MCEGLSDTAVLKSWCMGGIGNGLGVMSRISLNRGSVMSRILNRGLDVVLDVFFGFSVDNAGSYGFIVNDFLLSFNCDVFNDFFLSFNGDVFNNFFLSFDRDIFDFCFISLLWDIFDFGFVSLLWYIFNNCFVFNFRDVFRLVFDLIVVSDFLFNRDHFGEGLFNVFNNGSFIRNLFNIAFTFV